MINENLAHYSNLFIALALVAYAFAFFAYCGEWAFGSRSRIGAKAAAVGRSGQARTAAAAAPEDAVASVGASGVSVLTRTVQEGEEPTVAGGSLRAEIVGRFAVMATFIGFLLHASGVLCRGLAAQRVPWANMYEFSCAAALAMAFAYLVLLVTGRKARWLGLPVSFIVLLTLGLAYTVLYTDAEELVPALHSYWLYIHVTAAVLSTGAFGVATIATVLYLVKAAAEDGRLPRLGGVLERVPSSGALDRTAYRVIAFIFPLWTFAVIAGAIWAQKAWGRYWGWDPKETWSFIVWVIYAAYLHARATHGWKGRAAAWIALAAFVCVMFNYFGVNTLLTGKHSYAGL
ncbi:c-type cytochrome biogenesis protein CcsB [Actinocrinis puniceicyclus]|uniref:C-type cytochrome biogenesis protein CcsB n=1 Tax=Actinocrinis puniceicyclus TaxID=977794 RepID=A0A8J7WJS4_9ACTN|nr:c-type cytochrome biogenesis protein CcsB [Actinocrinis puniceicyclus]MBS2962180.1 c-type cytochrome biogenesis protein CcsB [Actinocrinis puniceicyclus]